MGNKFAFLKLTMLASVIAPGGNTLTEEDAKGLIGCIAGDVPTLAGLVYENLGDEGVALHLAISMEDPLAGMLQEISFERHLPEHTSSGPQEEPTSPYLEPGYFRYTDGGCGVGQWTRDEVLAAADAYRQKVQAEAATAEA